MTRAPRLKNLTLRRLRKQHASPRKPKGMGDDKEGVEHQKAVKTEVGAILALRKLGPDPVR